MSKGYKVVDRNFMSHGYQWMPGVTYSVDDAVIHYVIAPEYLFTYYRHFDVNSKVLEIEIPNEAMTETTNEIVYKTDMAKCVREISWEEILSMLRADSDETEAEELCEDEEENEEEDFSDDEEEEEEDEASYNPFPSPKGMMNAFLNVWHSWTDEEKEFAKANLMSPGDLEILENILREEAEGRTEGESLRAPDLW